MKNILITGGNVGLGLEISKSLIEEGNKVICLSRSETEDQFLKGNKNYSWIQFDLSELDNIDRGLRKNELIKDLEIHGLVNNSAIAYDDIVSNIKIDLLKKMFDVNVFAVMLLSKLMIRKAILNNNSLSIVNISSISAHTGYKGLSMYASTKGAVESFSKGVAREWGTSKIRSNCVVPGFMETNMSSSLSGDLKNKIYNRTSLKKPTSLKSVASTVSFLISEGSSSITGQNIFVDNGTI